MKCKKENMIIFKVIDGGKKNCINCTSFKTIKDNLKCAKCTDEFSGMYNRAVLIRGVVEELNRETGHYIRERCELYRGDCI